MAVSDPLGLTAQGLDTIHRRNKRYDYEQIAHTIRKYQIAEIVVGYPLRLSGAPSAQSDKVSNLADDLRRRFGLPIHLVDERLTSVEANRVLRDAELSLQKRTDSVDRLAAVLILQSFLDRRASQSPAESPPADGVGGCRD